MVNSIDGVGESPKSYKTSRELLDHLIQFHMDQHEIDLAKGDHKQLDVLLERAIAMMGLFMRVSASQDHEHSLEHTRRLPGRVKNIQDTYNNTATLVFTIASSLLSILGGIGGFAPVTGTRIFSVDMGKTIATASQGLSGVGTGVGAFGKIFDEKHTSLRVQAQALMEELKRARDERSQKAQQAEGRTRDSISDGRQHEKERQEARRAIFAN